MVRRVLLVLGGLLLLAGAISALASPRDRSTTTRITPTKPPAAEVAAVPAEPAPARDPVAIQWEAFTGYGPKLGEIVAKSDQFVDRATAGAVLSLPRGDRYTLTDQAAEMNGLMKAEAQGVSTPAEGRALKQSVYELVRARETAMNRAKDALDRPSASTESARTEAQRAADSKRSDVTLELGALCERLQATAEECAAVTGVTR